MEKSSFQYRVKKKAILRIANTSDITLTIFTLPTNVFFMYFYTDSGFMEEFMKFNLPFKCEIRMP